jgi:hypothetical protein
MADLWRLDRAKKTSRSALTGNRRQQVPQLQTACQATPETLISQFEIASDGLTRTRLHEVHAGSSAHQMPGSMPMHK